MYSVCCLHTYYMYFFESLLIFFKITIKNFISNLIERIVIQWFIRILKGVCSLV